MSHVILAPQEFAKSNLIANYCKNASFSRDCHTLDCDWLIFLLIYIAWQTPAKTAVLLKQHTYSSRDLHQIEVRSFLPFFVPSKSYSVFQDLAGFDAIEMEDETIKGIAIAILFFLTLLVGLLPLKIRPGGVPGNARQRILSYCNCFAGGVFFATCLLDLLPMIRDKYQQAFNLAGIHTVFPVAEFTTCIGFFLVLTIEQIVHTFHDSPLLHGSHGSHNQPLLGEAQSEDSFYSSSSSSFRPQKRKKAKPSESSLRVYVLIVALSMHSVFEGLALGLITDVDRLAQIAVAIVIHKSIIAFSLSVNLVQHEMETKTVVKSVLLFSIMAPIGIGIGIALLHNSSELSSSFSSGILQGIANGTFLFVTFFEIFQRELAEHGHRLLKVLFMIIGYSVVTGLLYYANVLEHESPSVQPQPGHGNGTAIPTTGSKSLV